MSMFKNRMCGMCGNFDGEVDFADFLGPKNCIYKNFNLLAAAWSAESDECDLYALMERRLPVTDFQKQNCKKAPRYSHDPSPQQDGWYRKYILVYK